MRIAIAAVLVFWGGIACAQGVLPNPRESEYLIPGLPDFSLSIVPRSATPPTSRERFWWSTEYVRWWVRNSQSPPLVTGGDPADLHPGSLDQPGTRILFG